MFPVVFDAVVEVQDFLQGFQAFCSGYATLQAYHEYYQ